MTRDDVARLAREAGMQGMLTDVVTTLDELERFAELVAATEREACAKVAEGFEQNRDWVRGSLYESIRNEVAARIRARGKATVKDSLTAGQPDVAAAVAAEREQCAKVCDKYAMARDHAWVPYVRSRECQQAANAIRARGEKGGA